MRREQAARRGEGSHRRSSAAAAASYQVKGRVVRYGECQKNHAASIGGFAVDGCREFMASLDHGEEGSYGALTCAACGCHRNFHRREVEVEDASDCSSPMSSNGK